MNVLVLVGSTRAASYNARMAEAVVAALPAHVAVSRFDLTTLPFYDADADAAGELGEVVDVFRRGVAAADAIVIATPVYKAAYSGVLKVFLDLLPQSALKGKTVLPLATGGSPHHMLALDYALRPVLQSLAARQILPGVYATDGQVTLQPEGAYQLQAELAQRLDEAVDTLASEGLKPQSPARWGFEPVAFSQVRCSV